MATATLDAVAAEALAPALDLQRTGHVHEDPLGSQRSGDGQHALGGTSEPVEAGIGADEEIDPLVSDALWGAGRCLPSSALVAGRSWCS